MSGVEKKVQEYKQKLIRINELKKKLIDCEMTWLTISEALNLTQYEYKKLIAGDLEEREAEIEALIERTPEHIKKRDKKAKTFQKLMLDKDITIKDFCKENNLDINKVYRALRDLPAERDIKLERTIEKALNVKIF